LKISIDPFTRIEGHLSVELEVEAGSVASATCSGTMFRGFEVLLRGRDPLDAPPITQRICGVCPVSHGIASSTAIENSLGLRPPTNGRLLRNLILAANYIQSDILHFYQLSALDFVDITAILSYTGDDPLLASVRGWVKAQIEGKAVNPAAPFLPRFEGDYITDADTNIGAISHYLQALRMRTMAHEMVATFGGKVPHVAAIVPGGITTTPTIDRIEAYRGRLRELIRFIDGCYLPDVKAVAKAFPQYLEAGRGPGALLAYGVFPEDDDNQEKLLSGGFYRDGQVAPLDVSKIQEDTQYSWLASPSGLHPSRGESQPAPGKAGAYSWVKAPRYDDQVVEVGPLARVLVTHASGKNPALSALVTRTMSELGLSTEQLFSALGRHLVRALECKLVAERCEAWLDELHPDRPAASGPIQIPDSARGLGLIEATRGALGHWIDISGGVISRYQCVVPTTWNCSPRDDKGRPGAVEQALAGLAIADGDNPIEAVRVVHSFDPCLACAVH
jgi:Ni,Fe-hydrogenase I large subunit